MRAGGQGEQPSSEKSGYPLIPPNPPKHWTVSSFDIAPSAGVRALWVRFRTA